MSLLSRTRIVRSCAVVLLVATANSAAAEPPAPSGSDALIAEGVALRRQGRAEEALAVFLRAEAVQVTPRSRAQVGLAEEALNRWVDAEKALQEALAGTGDPWIDMYRDVLGQALETAQRRLGWLDVAANPPGAELWIDGVRVGSFPLPVVRAPAGSVEVEVRAGGYIAMSRRVEIRAGEMTRESFTLTSATTPTPTSTSTSTPDMVDRPFQTAAWLTAGGSLLLLAGGISANIWREQEAAYWNSTACQQGGATRGAQCGSYFTQASIGTVLAVVGYSLAGALGISSTYLFVRSAQSHSARASVAMVPSCSIGAAAFACSLEF